MSNLDTGGELPKKRKQSRIRERSAMWPEGSPLLMVHMTESVQAIERRLQRQMEGEHDFPRSDCLFFAMPPLSSLLTGVRHQYHSWGLQVACFIIEPASQRKCLREKCL